jgi:hypothetical protein
MHAMPPIYITFLNRLDIEALALSDDEIIAAIETSLAAQGRGQTVIEPRVHLAPGLSNGHFNVLRGAIAAPVDRAGIKVVGDFVDNYKLGYPSELGVVLLLDPRIGAPRAILDGAGSAAADVAYCNRLADLYDRYLGQSDNSPQRDNVANNLEGQVASTQCREGKPDRAIPALERILRGNRFTLPPRG